MIDKCYECGTSRDIVYHHVVPKSKGGTKTVPLCEFHHELVHNKKFIEMRKLKDSKKLELAKNGFIPFGNIAFGYKLIGERGRKKLKPNNDIKIVSFIFKKTFELIKDNCWSKTMITQKTFRALNKKNYLYHNSRHVARGNPKYKKFSNHNLKNILSNKIYTGYFKYSGNFYPHNHGIIDKITFEQIQNFKNS